jgi:hypothetical protein
LAKKKTIQTNQASATGNTRMRRAANIFRFLSRSELLAAEPWSG